MPWYLESTYSVIHCSTRDQRKGSLISADQIARDDYIINTATNKIVVTGCPRLVVVG